MLLFPLTILLSVETLLSLLLCAPWQVIRRIPVSLLSLSKNTAVKIVVNTISAVLALVLVLDLISLRQLFDRAFVARTDAAAGIGNTLNGSILEARFELLKEGIEALMLAAVLLVGLLIAHLASSLKSNELQVLSVETLKKQAKGLQDEYMRLRDQADGTESEETSRRVAALKETIDRLEQDNNKFMADAERWQAKCRSADANVAAIRKQTEGLQLEYDRLMSDNESLRSQLGVFDRKYSTAKKGL